MDEQAYKEFVKLVGEMRQAQKDYFHNRAPHHLQRAKELERNVDRVVNLHRAPELF